MTDTEEEFMDANDVLEVNEPESVDDVYKYITNEKLKKFKYLEKYNMIVSFLENKVHPLFTTDYVNFSSGKFQKTENKFENSYNFTMLSYNHMPSEIVLSQFFMNSVKPTLNREKSSNHIDSLLKLNYQESMFDTSPLIFAIMNKKVKKEIDTNYPSQYLHNSTDDIMNNKYAIYTLDGQHRLSTIYKYYGLNSSNNSNNKLFKNKYFDFKFIFINNVEEYKTIYFAINNSLPQKPSELETSDPVNIINLIQNINTHFNDLYKLRHKKKSSKKMICEDEKISKPEAPCIHVEELKKSDKLKQLVKKYGIKILFDKMIKLNSEYAWKEVTFFGHKSDHASRAYENVKAYGFYLGFHKGKPMKWIDEIE
jgi:hypothetical protein